MSNPLKSLVSVPGLPSTACWVREGTRSTSPTLRSELILFSAEYSCQPRAKHPTADTAAKGSEEGGKKDAEDECVYPRGELDCAEETC